MVLYVTLSMEGQAPEGEKRPSGKKAPRNGRMEDSGQQNAEPALAGELKAIAESDCPRGAPQGGGHGDIPRALRYLPAPSGPIHFPTLASVLVRGFRRARHPTRQR